MFRFIKTLFCLLPLLFLTGCEELDLSASNGSTVNASFTLDDEPFQDGDLVLLYNPGKLIALSQTYDGYYNKGVDISESFSKQEVWTLKKDGDSYSFLSMDGQPLSLNDDYDSMPLGGKYTKWKIVQDHEDTYLIYNQDRDLAIEWYEKQGRWTAYKYKDGINDAFLVTIEVISKKDYAALPGEEPANIDEPLIDEDGEFQTKDEVALYIKTYHHLPSNYMTKREARQYGWENGPLYQVIPGKSIGGDVYSNYEGALPDIKGKYIECDIDTLGKSSRGSKRIVYDPDFNIYYTDDHYETFTKLNP